MPSRPRTLHQYRDDIASALEAGMSIPNLARTYGVRGYVLEEFIRLYVSGGKHDT